MTVRSASPSSSAGLFRKRGALGDSEDFAVVHSLLGTWPRIASCSSRAQIWFAFPSIDAGDGGAFRRAVPGFLIFVLAVASGCSSLFELPTVATGPASALGTAAITVNGSVNPHAVATHYYFEYGTSAAYGKRTPVRELPSRLAAYFYESWDEGPGGWTTWGVKQSLHRDGGHSNGFLRISEPSTLNDYNHRMAGILHLAKFFYSGPVYKSAYLGGGDPDFRDARVRLWVRGNDWKPNGSELIWWTQSQSNIEAGNQRGVFRRANWGYTGFTLTAHLRDGNWNRVEYRLRNDTTQWTYGGSNLGSDGRKYYSYWSIDQALGHLNCNFFHLLAFVDPHNPPTGSIDFDEFELAYRNESLVFPSNGGKLIDWPRYSKVDPATLTDGWRHGEDRMWKSQENPADPQEFTYTFESEVTIDTVQLHQNPEWPGKDVEVLVSADGKSYQSILKRPFPEKSNSGPNFDFVVEQGLASKARYLRVRLSSGYQRRYWGLGEIEIFGSGATMVPDDDDYYVNTDLYDVKPGETCHYRLVATNSRGSGYGEDRTFTLPASDQPQVLTGQSSRINGSTARLQGRVNPMGVPTYFWFEYGTDEEYGSKTEVRYAGLEQTPRTVFETLTGLGSRTTYYYRTVAVNGSGTGYGDAARFSTTALSASEGR